MGPKYGPTAGTSYTYKVDSQTLTCREGYTHLGWADTADATEAKYHGGDEITLTKDNPIMTIYAVWEEHEHKDDDGDGFVMMIRPACIRRTATVTAPFPAARIRTPAARKRQTRSPAFRSPATTCSRP